MLTYDFCSLCYSYIVLHSINWLLNISTMQCHFGKVMNIMKFQSDNYMCTNMKKGQTYIYLVLKKSNVFCAASFIRDFSENCWEFHCCPIHSPQHISCTWWSIEGFKLPPVSKDIFVTTIINNQSEYFQVQEQRTVYTVHVEMDISSLYSFILLSI